MRTPPIVIDLGKLPLKRHTDLRDSYSASVVVQDSSAVEPHIWLFIEGGEVSNNSGAAHLTPVQAEALRDGLTVAIASMDDQEPSRQ